MSSQQNINPSPTQLLENMFDTEMSFIKSDMRDARMLARAFHPDVVVHEPSSLPYAGDWCGLEGLARLFRKMHETFSDMTVEALVSSQTGDTVFVSCVLSMTSRATGIVVRQPFAEVLHFEDGLLIEGTPFYFDTAEILTAIRGC